MRRDREIKADAGLLAVTAVVTFAAALGVLLLYRVMESRFAFLRRGTKKAPGLQSRGFG